LVDIDFFTPWNFQLHLVKGLPIAFLAFDRFIDLNKEQE
jgi:hypothetical protein